MKIHYVITKKPSNTTKLNVSRWFYTNKNIPVKHFAKKSYKNLRRYIKLLIIKYTAKNKSGVIFLKCGVHFRDLFIGKYVDFLE